jgi:hypothetical protein
VADIEVLILGEGNLFVLRNQGAVLLGDAVLGHRLLYHRPERRRELRRGLVLEVVRGGGVTGGKDSARVIEGHGRDGVKKDFSRCGSGRLRGPIHAKDKIVYFGPVANQPQTFFQCPQVAGHQNLDVGMAKVSVGDAQ